MSWPVQYLRVGGANPNGRWKGMGLVQHFGQGPPPPSTKACGDPYWLDLWRCVSLSRQWVSQCSRDFGAANVPAATIRLCMLSFLTVRPHEFVDDTEDNLLI